MFTDVEIHYTTIFIQVYTSTQTETKPEFRQGKISKRN